MIGLDRSDNLIALARRVGFELDELAHEERVVTKANDDGRRREVMVADVLDLGGIRKGSMVRSKRTTTRTFVKECIYDISTKLTSSRDILLSNFFPFIPSSFSHSFPPPLLSPFLQPRKPPPKKKTTIHENSPKKRTLRFRLRRFTISPRRLDDFRRSKGFFKCFRRRMDEG